MKITCPNCSRIIEIVLEDVDVFPKINTIQLCAMKDIMMEVRKCSFCDI